MAKVKDMTDPFARYGQHVNNRVGPGGWAVRPVHLERVHFGWNHECALSFWFDAFSLREPVSASLENALVSV
jgi:hypothetical protein